MFYSTLLEAVEKEDYDDVKAYINGGADVNIKDSKENTILHKAVSLENEEIVEFLIHSNADVNSLNYIKETPLHCAIKKQNLKIIRLLIDAGSDMYSKNNFDGTPLQLAAKVGDTYEERLASNNQTNAISIIKLLQSRGVDIKQDHGITALWNAYAGGYLDVAKVLIDAGADPIGLIYTGITGLHSAAQRNNIPVIEFILSHGVDINTKEKNSNRTPLHYAIEASKDDSHLNLIEFLLKKGADVNSITGAGGYTPLNYLVINKSKNFKTLQLLIDYKADVNVDNPLIRAISCSRNFEYIRYLVDLGSDVNCVSTLNGKTPLLSACFPGFFDAVKLLVDRGSDVNYVNSKDGSTPLLSACFAGPLSVVKLLVDHGADVNYVNPINGSTPLIGACSAGIFDTVKLLVDRSSDVNYVNSKDGSTPLLSAFSASPLNVNVVKLLVDQGADVNYVNFENGLTPLLLAISKGSDEVIQLLVGNKADVNYFNFKDGSTPLHHACSKGNLQIIDYLLTLGANVDVFDFNGNSPLTNLLKFKPEKKDKSYMEKIRFFIKYFNVNTIDLNENNILTHANSEGYAWKIILEHIAKLQAVNLQLHPSILNTISNHAEFNYYFNKCTNELLLSKSNKLPNSWITFFNLLVDEKRKLKNYAGNEDLVNYFEKNSCRKKFYIFGAEMHKNMAKGLKRRELYDKSTVLLSNVLPIYNPTHLIIRDILDCVTTKNLSIFCEKN